MNLQSPTFENIIETMENDPDAVANLLLFLIGENAELKKQVKELERRLNQNSSNSSRPPSSDGFNKSPKPKSLRGKSDKKSGGQSGHKGSYLKMSDNPDHTLYHAVSTCEKCQHALHDVEALSYKKRQVYDLVAYIEVTEHQAQTTCCPHCQHVNEASFPEDVPFSTQYGNILKAFASYCSVYQMIPSERVSDMIFDLTGHRLSEGTLYNTNERLAELLIPYEEQVKQRLLDEPVINHDESGLRVAAKNHWLHSASTEDLTHYTVHEKRGKEGMDDAGILPYFTGVSVHDGWSPYWKYDQCSHALCNIHHERELRAVIENDKQQWAQDMINLLHEMKNTVAATLSLGRDQLDKEQIISFETRYDVLIKQGLAQNPPTPPPKDKKRGRVAQSKTRNLLNRLDQNRSAVLLFMHDFRVPFTNNQAEQDVRMIKVHQKVSGSFRTLKGSQRFARIRGYISTLRKQGLSVINHLRGAFEGKPWMPPDS